MSNKVLIISNTNELVRIKPERVQCQQLMEEQLGKEAMTFIRLGKQLIVNRAYIFKINPNKQQLYMSNSEVNIAFELQASKEALKQLKALIESEIGKEAKL